MNETSSSHAPLTESEMASLWGKLETDVSQKPSYVERLRQLSGVARFSLALAFSSAGIAALLALSGMHTSIETSPWQRTLILVPVAALALYSLLVALRGYHQPHSQREHIATLIALLLPLCLGAAPWFLYRISEGSIYSDTCISVGLSAGALASLTSLAMQRSFKSSLTRALASAAFGGLVAFFTLELHCPSHNSWHLLSTHALASMVLALSTTLVWTMMRRHRRNSAYPR